MATKKGSVKQLKPIESTESFNKEDVKKSKEELIKEAQELRQSEIGKCAQKIEAILEEYNLRLTAEIIVGERGATPRVYLDERV